MTAPFFITHKESNDGTGVVAQNPYWLLVTFPFKYPDTLDRTKPPQAKPGDYRVVSSELAQNDPVTTVTPIIFDSEVVQWTFSESKSSHMKNLSLSMVNNDNSLVLLEWLTPGDWCMFFAFNTREAYEKIKGRLQSAHGARTWYNVTRGISTTPESSDRGKSINESDSGLKFIGRLHSTQHHERRMDNGTFDVGYSVQAVSFSELDSYIYYNQFLSLAYPNGVGPSGNLRLAFAQNNDFITVLNNAERERGGFLNVNILVPLIIKTFLGKGADTRANQIKVDLGNSRIEDVTVKTSPNLDYQVPSAVLSTLDFGTTGVSRQYYADVLQMFIGVQKHTSTAYDPNQPSDHNNLIPDIDSTTLTNPVNQVFYTPQPLEDKFNVNALKLFNTSPWLAAAGFVNAPINEMYTALKPNPRNNCLVPTLVVRRAPYTSDEYLNANAPDMTISSNPMSSLPCWVVSPEAMLEFSVGRTDAMRYNYVEVTPQVRPTLRPQQEMVTNTVAAMPTVDDVSIRRHGLRMGGGQVGAISDSAGLVQEKYTIAKYTGFLADVLMDGHMRYNGVLSCVGIQEPITVGDNLMVNNDMLLHIEAVTHTGGISPSGAKSFATTLQLSHGVPMKLFKANQDRKFYDPQQDGSSIFVGSFDAGLEGPVKKRDKQSEQSSLDKASNVKIIKPAETIEIRSARQELSEMGLIGAQTSFNSNTEE